MPTITVYFSRAFATMWTALWSFITMLFLALFKPFQVIAPDAEQRPLVVQSMSPPPASATRDWFAAYRMPQHRRMLVLD